MKKPADCQSIDEIRAGIDEIDKQIIALLGKRLEFVQEIVKFKKDEVDVKAKSRYDQVIELRREWARKSSFDPDIVEKIYRMMMDYFIEVQKEVLSKRSAEHKQA